MRRSTGSTTASWITFLAAGSLAVSVTGCDASTQLSGDGANEVVRDVGGWIETITDVGDAGWRDSTDPWSPADLAPATRCQAAAVWSDPEATYALIRWRRTTGGLAEEGFAIDSNAGTGWSPFCSRPCDPLLAGGCPEELTGAIAGDLITWPLFLRAGLGRTALADSRVDRVRAVHVVDDHLAYAIAESLLPQLVMRFDGTAWEPLPEILPSVAPLTALWADASTVVAAGENGTVLVSDGTAFRQVDSGTLANIAAVGGFSATDIWFSTADQHSRLMHFDGLVSREVAWPDAGRGDECDGSRIRRMWAHDGQLFLTTTHQLLRLRDGSVEMIAHWPGDVVPGTTPPTCEGGLWIHDLWGNSPTEVFLAVGDDGSLVPDEPCLSFHLLYWDGLTFHWF